MKAKFGDLTLRKLNDVCQKQPTCTRCPLYGICSDPRIRNAKLNAEIELPEDSPVVHAHWIPKKEMLRSPEAKNYNCSACGKESFAYPNCPYCRAIMDGEESEK